MENPDNFILLNGTFYQTFLSEIHTILRPETYLHTTLLAGLRCYSERYQADRIQNVFNLASKVFH
jgi:hypothetical protein